MKWGSNTMTVDLNSRYGLNPAHSEVVEACETVAPGKVLDMGCSNGRNALYLSQLGFDVTAVDNNPNANVTLTVKPVLPKVLPTLLAVSAARGKRSSGDNR